MSHPHFCDCLECMGGIPWQGAGAAYPDPPLLQNRWREVVPGFASQTDVGLRLEQAARGRGRWRKAAA